MLEIMKKSLVTTRRSHECFACTQTMEKGIKAVYVTAKQDNCHTRFHLHEHCNKQLAKNKNALSDGIYRGCLNDIEPTPQWLSEG